MRKKKHKLSFVSYKHEQFKNVQHENAKKNTDGEDQIKDPTWLGVLDCLINLTILYSVNTSFISDNLLHRVPDLATLIKISSRVPALLLSFIRCKRR